MGRAPCCDKANVKRGPWSPEEDLKLKEYIDKYGTGGNWIALPQKVGLKRCGKSCRLRWLNYLRPNIKHGEFSDDEDRIICTLFASIGSRWSIIAAQLPGRTDNDIKNYWNTKLRKKLMGFSPLLLSSATAQPVSSKQQIKPHHNYQSTVTTTTFTSSPSSYCFSRPLSVATAVRSCFGSGFDPVSSSDLLSPPPYYFQPMRETLLMNNTSPFQLQQTYSPEATNLVKEYNNFLMFGGHEAPSCSSSDGSSGNLHMSHDNKGMDFDYGSEQLGLGFQSCINYQNNNGGGAEENNKLMMMMAMADNNTESGESEWTNNEKPSETWSESNPASLEYYGSIEEIKQLFSSNDNSSSIIPVDVIRTEERTAMYY